MLIIIVFLHIALIGHSVLSMPFSSHRPRVSYSCPEECIQSFNEKTLDLYDNQNKMAGPISVEYCWHFLDLTHCLSHCGKNEYSGSIWLSSMTDSCATHFKRVAEPISCMDKNHETIEDHCLQYMDAAVSTTKFILSNQNSPAPYKSRLCEHLRDHSQCLVANMEFYCGPEAVKLFSRQNLFRFFQNFIRDRTGKVLEKEFVSDCYLIPLMPPFLPPSLVDLALSPSQSATSYEQRHWSLTSDAGPSNTLSVPAIIVISVVSVIFIVFVLTLITRWFIGFVVVNFL